MPGFVSERREDRDYVDITRSNSPTVSAFLFLFGHGGIREGEGVGVERGGIAKRRCVGGAAW